MSRSDRLPRLLLTIGDINGIGPEVLLKGLHGALVEYSFLPTIVGNSRLLREYLERFPLPDISVDSSEVRIDRYTVPIIDIPSDAILKPGTETEEAGKLAGDAIRKGVSILMEGNAEGLVTMPISKHGLNIGGYPWPGHTEMLADLSGENRPLMILASENLRVALVTIHVPISQVASLITPERLRESILDFHRALQQDFGRSSPRIAILGLNPHAGEEGSIGTEEVEIFRPVITRLQHDGLLLEGPFPADGFFARYRPGVYDGVLAAYHDQGLIPLKMSARGGGVNITAGLPLVRTSPDHGTGFDIAGNGIADESSTVQAIAMALRIIANRKSHISEGDD